METAKTSQTSGLRNCGQSVHRVRIGEQPVEEPRPAQVQQREQPGAGDGEQRHRLGEAVDRRAPLLLQQQQDRRDQRAGVADADPPDEVDDREAPGDRDVDAPDADALDEQIGDRDHAAASTSANATPKPSHQPTRRLARQHDRADLVGDRAERVAGRDHWRRVAAARAIGAGRICDRDQDVSACSIDAQGPFSQAPDSGCCSAAR